MRGLFLLAFGCVQITCYPFGNQNQEFIWDIDRCSNINPIFDRRTVSLTTAGGKYPEDQLCHAIRRDLKVNDDTAYSMTAEFSPLTEKAAWGFIFNLWDDFNYDFVYLT